MTINDAIKRVLSESPDPLSPRDIYLKIEEKNLYEFKSKTPEHIVRTALRRKCSAFDFKSAHKEKLYELASPGKFSLLKF